MKKPILILFALTAVTQASIQPQASSDSIETILQKDELLPEFFRQHNYASSEDQLELEEEKPKLKQSLPSQCESTYTPSTDATIAENYYFWSIEGAPFNKSVYTPYMTNVLTGLRLTYYFEYSTECTQQMQNLLSQIYFTVKNGSCNDPQFDIKLMTYYASQVMSTEFANSFYNCYLFSDSIQKVANARFSKFSDFADLYTSFLFNLLSQSLSLRNLGVSIQTNYAEAKYPEMSGDIAKLIRIVLDFTSSNAASLESAEDKENLEKAKSIFNYLKKENGLTFTDKLMVQLSQAELDFTEQLKYILAQTATNPWQSLSFKISDIFNIPLGVIEGAMAAIESNRASLFCSRNSTAARRNIYSMQSLLASSQVKDAMAQFYQFLQKTDDLIINCGDSVFNAQFPILFETTATNPDSPNAYFGENFIQNILYNIGFMFTDVLDLIFIDPTNTDPFWYYVFFRVGDFFIRFLFRETTTAV